MNTSSDEKKNTVPDTHGVKSETDSEDESLNYDHRVNVTEQIQNTDPLTGFRNSRGELIINRNFWDNTTIPPHIMEYLALEVTHKTEDDTVSDNGGENSDCDDDSIVDNESKHSEDVAKDCGDNNNDGDSDERKHSEDNGNDGDDNNNDDDSDDVYDMQMASCDAEGYNMMGPYATKCYCKGMFLIEFEGLLPPIK